MNKFRTNYNALPEFREIITGKDKTVPNQASSITEIVYRFQGGIIPKFHNVTYDTQFKDTDEIDVRNLSGFDITDAFQALQQGKKEYREYITTKKQIAAEAIKIKQLEFQRLQEFEKQQLSIQKQLNNEK